MQSDNPTPDGGDASRQRSRTPGRMSTVPTTWVDDSVVDWLVRTLPSLVDPAVRRRVHIKRPHLAAHLLSSRPSTNTHRLIPRPLSPDFESRRRRGAREPPTITDAAATVETSVSRRRHKRERKVKSYFI